jgi:hypothetical protein
MSPVLRLLLRGGAVAAVMFAAYRFIGAHGLVFMAPLAGLALARPLVEAAAGYPRLASRIALRKVAGRYVEYRGKSLDVHIDERANCWISTADLRKLVALPADAVLLRRFPAGCRETGEPVQWRLEGQALVEFLAGATDPDITRLCHWLQRDVMRPAWNKRADRMGLARQD